MRRFVTTVCWLTILLLPQVSPVAIAQDLKPIQPLPKFMDSVAGLARLELANGRMSLNPENWLEAAYPASKGDRLSQMLAEAKNSGPMTLTFRLKKEDFERTPYLCATRALFQRIRTQSGTVAGGSGGDSGGSACDFSTTDYAANLSVFWKPLAHFSFSQHRLPFDQHERDRRHLSIDDLPNDLIRIGYGDADRTALITQSNNLRIQAVKIDANRPAAMVWPDYSAMIADAGELRKEIDLDLAALRVGLPSAPADRSTLNAQPRKIQGVGPLNRLAAETADLIPIRLVNGRLTLNRLHWGDVTEIARKTPSTRASRSLLDEPYFKTLPIDVQQRMKQSMEQSEEVLGPLKILIDRFVSAMRLGAGRSGGAARTMTRNARSADLVARFFADHETGYVRMSLLECTPHARCITVEESRDTRFVLTYSDPEHMIVIVQGPDQKIGSAACGGAKKKATSWNSYEAMIQGKDPSLTLWNRLVAPLGPVMPPPPQP